MLLFLTVHSVFASPAVQSIEAMTGCFEVTFQYEEITPLKKGYELEEPYSSSVIEWVTVHKKEDRSISLQHVLVSGPAMIRHWRQEWIYEPTELYTYTSYNTWSRQDIPTLETKGSWAQLVTNVDDAPRYQCNSHWQSDEDSDFWTCATLSPVPRRDSERTDYNMLERINTHRILKDGWVHEQQNTKFLDTETGREDVVVERGYNTYKKVEDAMCKDAIEWWPSQVHVWDGIILGWSDILSEYDAITLKDRHHGLPLWIRLFWMAKRNQNSEIERVRTKSHSIIERYIVSE